MPHAAVIETGRAVSGAPGPGEAGPTMCGPSSSGAVIRGGLIPTSVVDDPGDGIGDGGEPKHEPADPLPLREPDGLA